MAPALQIPSQPVDPIEPTEMDTTRETTRPGETREADRALPTILRGEEVLEEARHVPQKISGQVARAVTERTPPDGQGQGRQ